MTGKRLLEREEADHATIIRRIETVNDGASPTLLGTVDLAVQAYIASAPERYKVTTDAAWTQRKRMLEKARLEAARGGMVIRTTPAGAWLRVGGSALERTPITLKEQKPGRYPVDIRLTGYEDWHGEIEVKKDEVTEINVPLVSSFGGKLQVDSAPSGLEFTLVGQGRTENGSTPANFDSLPVGSYTISFSRDRWQGSRHTVEVRCGQTTQVSGELAGDNTARSRTLILPGSVNLDLVPIPAGTFAMGSTNGAADEKPVTQVRITQAFWLGKTEVTQGQWEAVMGRNPSTFEGTNLPVETVSYDDAMSFCRKLTERERDAGRLPDGYKYTLPTEAQWEYSCRAGTTSDYAGSLDPIGWYGANSKGSTHVVAQKQANAWGLHDMQGNVWEWCRDWYADKLPGGSVIDSTGPAAGARRVSRGGCWNSTAACCRSANRYGIEPGYRGSFLGFRLALVLVLPAEMANVAPVKVDDEIVVLSPNIAGQEKANERKSARVVMLSGSVTLDMVPVPAGNFVMGSTKGNDNEEPVTQVRITQAFWLGKTAVTQGQWEAVMGRNPSTFKGTNLPVETVSYDDALSFCQKLTERERAAGRLPVGNEYTLPTEAQWEYACRAGTSRYYAGSLDSLGWYDKNSGMMTHDVAQKEANAWGLYDMLGNVWEWCRDWCGGKLPGGRITDPTGPATGTSRVLRGGSWNNTAANCRSAYPGGNGPGFRSNDLGFRVALVPQFTR